MTMTNAEWMIKNGYKFIDLDAKLIDPLRGSRITLNGKTIDWTSLNNSANAICSWLDMEHKEPILDEAEKRYLKGVIRPFRVDVKYIVKYGGHFSSRAYEEIAVRYQDKRCGDAYSFILPKFEKGTMYKGMEVNRHYTLEELGL